MCNRKKERKKGEQTKVPKSAFGRENVKKLTLRDKQNTILDTVS